MRKGTISDEEQRELARRWRELGDERARARLVEVNVGIAWSVAREYSSLHVPLEDLAQDACEGLCRAADRYEPGRGVPFRAYAAYWARACVLRRLELSRLVQARRTKDSRVAFYRLRAAEARLGAQASDAQLAEELGVAEAAVAQERASRSAPVSLDGDLLGLVEGEVATRDGWGETPEDVTARAETVEAVRAVVLQVGRRLDVRGRVILRRRLVAAEPATLNEIGGELCLSRERVRQLETRVVDLLRRSLADILA